MAYNLQQSSTDQVLLFENILTSLSSTQHDLIIITKEGREVFTQKSVLYCFSKTFADWLSSLSSCRNEIVTVFVDGSFEAVSNMLTVLSSGKAEITQESDLFDMVEVSEMFGIDMENSEMEFKLSLQKIRQTRKEKNKKIKELTAEEFNFIKEEDLLSKEVNAESINEETEINWVFDTTENESNNAQVDKTKNIPKKYTQRVKDRCDKCTFYSKRGALRAHILESHTEIDQQDNSIKEEKSITGIIENEVVSNVEVKIETLEQKVSIGSKCNDCESVLPRGSLKHHIIHFHPERRTIHKCETCQYECLHESTLQHHVATTHRVSSTCNYCTKIVKFMEPHLEKFHPDKLESFDCKYCSFMTSKKGKLDSHVRRKHESKRGKCVKCNTFTKNLPNHIKKHEQNKFECIPCSKNFSVKRDLCRHILYEHEKKRSSCDICGKTSVTNLKKHVEFNHPEMANSVEDDEIKNRDRIASELGEAWQFLG